MRHFLSHVLLASLTVFLVVISVLFAWVRSSQLAVTREEVILEHQVRPAAGEPGEFRWREVAARSYAANCQNCHGPEGRGWDQYPGLGHTGRLGAAEGGREFLVDLHLYGLTSGRWRAPMPALGTMPDAEIAAVINYMLEEFAGEVAGEDFRVYTPEEVAARRGAGLTPREVNASRPSPGE